MKIRLLAKNDLPERVEWMNNPSVYRTMHFTPPISLEKTLEWHQKNVHNNSRCDVTFEDDNGELVAMGGLTSIDYSVRKAEFYIFVNPKFQRKGIGTEATYLLCKYGFEVLQLHKIYLYTNANNAGARRTYEKVGFTLEGIHRGEMIEGEEYLDRLYYGLLANEFDKDRVNMAFGGASDMIVERHNICGKEVAILRDDLFPKMGGGIKVRKSVHYENSMLTGGYNACVTTGGIQSNHNRAIALMCARHGWRCHLVYHGTRERFEAEKGNALLVRKSGATVEFVEADRIGPAMDAAMDRLTGEGFKPMYIHGGGHDLEGGMALVDAVCNLKSKCETVGFKPDHIVHASGTGSTQAGIVVGLDVAGWGDVKVTGISVARQKERGTEVIEDFADMLAGHYGLPQNYKGRIDFNTDYLCGGYEKYTPGMADFLDGVMRTTGIMFDTTYSGKALYGMADLMRRGLISGNVLFWHTGGLMNLLK